MNPKKEIKDLIEYKDKKTQKMMKKTETVKVERSIPPPNVSLAEGKPKGLNQMNGSSTEIPLAPIDDKRDASSVAEEKSSVEEVSSEDKDTSSSSK